MTRRKLSEKAKAFINQTPKPTFIGRVGDYDFYEDPINGDEAPLIEIGPDGKVKRSDFWETPDIDELY